MTPDQQAARDAALEEVERLLQTQAIALRSENVEDAFQHVIELARALRTTPPSAAPGEITQEQARRMRDALEGCLHFDDGFVGHGIIGQALAEWRKEARAALAGVPAP